VQRWQKVSDHLPPLAGKEPPEMIEGEEADEDEEEDKGDRTESDSEALSKEAAGRTRGSKRGARLLRKHLQRSPPRRKRRRRLHHPRGRPLLLARTSLGPSDCGRLSWRAVYRSNARSGR
jgi:hypothetical protein